MTPRACVSPVKRSGDSLTGELRDRVETFIDDGVDEAVDTLFTEPRRMTGEALNRSRSP